MQDLLKMLPHSKKDAKFDLRDGMPAVNEVSLPPLRGVFLILSDS